MKAVQLQKNSDLKLVSIPRQPTKPREYLVKIAVCGICSSDIPRAFEGGAYYYPLIMGHEFSGVIDEVGENCSDFNKGDRVAVFPLKPCFKCGSCINQNYAQCSSYDYYGSRTDGAYAEYLSVAEWNLVRIPDCVSLEDAALLEPLSVVVHGLKKARLFRSATENKRVLIIGAGFLGLLAVEILKKHNPHLDLYVCDRNSFKLAIAERQGAKVSTVADDAQWADYIEKQSDSMDYVIEMTGWPRNLSASLRLAARHATVLWLGNVSGDVSLAKDDVSGVLRKEINVMGTWNSVYRGARDDDWSDAVDLMRSGLSPSGLVTHWTKLDGTPSLLAKVASHKARTSTFDHIKCAIKNA